MTVNNFLTSHILRSKLFRSCKLVAKIIGGIKQNPTENTFNVITFYHLLTNQKTIFNLLILEGGELKSSRIISSHLIYGSASSIVFCKLLKKRKKKKKGKRERDAGRDVGKEK